jgi:hypothetical protein
MLRTEIKTLEARIKSHLTAVETEHLDMLSKTHEQFPGWIQKHLMDQIKELYYLILVYLEARKLPHYFETFKTAFDKVLREGNDLLDVKLAHPDGAQSLAVLIDYKAFLQPFKAFGFGETFSNELNTLIRIVKNTAVIMRNAQIEVLSEYEINRQLQWVLGLYFPSCCIGSKMSITGRLKVYAPSLFIPEIGAAIGYKVFKDTEDEVVQYLELLKAEDGTARDTRYRRFLLGLYVDSAAVNNGAYGRLTRICREEFATPWKMIVIKPQASII